MGYSENDFYESGTHGGVPSRLRNTHQTKLAEEAFENEERMKRIFAKASEAQNELHKSSFLGFNGGKTVSNTSFILILSFSFKNYSIDYYDDQLFLI